MLPKQYLKNFLQIKFDRQYFYGKTLSEIKDIQQYDLLEDENHILYIVVDKGTAGLNTYVFDTGELKFISAEDMKKTYKLYKAKNETIKDHIKSFIENIQMTEEPFSSSNKLNLGTIIVDTNNQKWLVNKRNSETEFLLARIPLHSDVVIVHTFKTNNTNDIQMTKNLLVAKKKARG